MQYPVYTQCKILCSLREKTFLGKSLAYVSLTGMKLTPAYIHDVWNGFYRVETGLHTNTYISDFYSIPAVIFPQMFIYLHRNTMKRNRRFYHWSTCNNFQLRCFMELNEHGKLSKTALYPAHFPRDNPQHCNWWSVFSNTILRILSHEHFYASTC